MKKLVWLFSAIILASCNTGVKEYASIKGKLNKADVKSIAVQGKDYLKEIEVKSDGTFSDTIIAPAGFYALSVGNQRSSLYLKKGFDLNIEFNDDNVSVAFKGNGAETNNYIEEMRGFFMSEYASPSSYFQLDKKAYDSRISKAKQMANASTVDIEKVDPVVVDMITKSKDKLFSYVSVNYKQMHDGLVLLGKGKTSPVFENYENFAGGTTSLSDLKGKFVYLDIWATWCGPCKREIPHLKALEKEFHGKNIEFVSISVDNVDGRRGSHESWLKMVEDMQLGGTQLFADKDFSSDFIKAYNVNSIPRFILVDPEGNIVESNAMRPSNPNISDYLKGLGI